MIGVDLVSISRFEKSKKLHKFIDRFGVDGNDALAVAKTWACLEAVIKAEDCAFAPDSIRIKVPVGQRPVVEDPNQVLSCNYVLSLSHENNLVIAVAQRC